MYVKEYHIINVSKRLDASNVSEFKSSAMEYLKDDSKGIILNFSETNFLDSAGLGALVSILKAASQHKDKQMALVELSRQVRQIFELTKLYRLFDIFDSIDDAVKELEG